MNEHLETIANWLADFYLLSSVLLALTLAGFAVTRQPVRRRAAAQSAIASLFLLAALCAVPGWSTVSLISRPRPAVTDDPPHQRMEQPIPDKAVDIDRMRPNPIEVATASPRVAGLSPAAETSTGSVTTRQNPWPALAALAWSGGALGVLTWLAIGWVAARRMRRDARRAPPALVELMKRVGGLNDTARRAVDLLVSGRIDVAVALGIWRPAVLLPAKWTTDFPVLLSQGPGESSTESPKQLHTVLAHELAHIENRDLHWLAASRALLVALWAQPLFWLLRRRMRLDQEALADAVAAEITSRQNYAEQLVAWARNIPARPALRLTPAVGLWEGPSQLRQRVALLVDDRLIFLRECSRRWKTVSFATGVIAAFALSLITFEPKVRSQTRAATEPASPKSAADADKIESRDIHTTEPSHYVRLVMDPKGELTFEGEKTDWDHVVELLEKVPDRSQTVLEFAIASDQISIRDMEDARARAMVYAKQFGFLYGSYIGVHPLGTKGSATSQDQSKKDESSGTDSATRTQSERASQTDSTTKRDDEHGSQMLREIRAASAPILAAMAKDYGYGLEQGQDLRRVAPPFPSIRMQYYRTGHPSQSEAIKDGPSAMVFRSRDGKLRNWGMTFGDSADPGYNLTGVVDALLDIKSQEIDGPRELLDTRLAGDWVIREGAGKEAVVEQLQKILRNEFSLPVKLEFRDVEREVYVARGDYELTPLPGQEGKGKLILTDETITTDEIQIFGTELVPNSGAGGGTGEFEEFLGWLGRWIGTPIVSEVDLKPTNQVSWHLHERSPSTDQTRGEDHDAILVLGNITLQTGLTFTLEKRPVRILFVERTQ